MRDAVNVVARGVVVVSIVMLMAIPAEAGPRDGGWWLERRADPIVKIVRRIFGITSQGDGLTIPTP